MAGTGKKWLLGCGVGCGLIIVIGIILSIGGAIVMTRPFNDAVNAQKELTDTLGDREAYAAPPGAVTADMLQRFLAVRRAIIPLCEEFDDIADSFEAMDDLDDEDDPPVGDVLQGVGRIMGSVFGFAGAIGEVNLERNKALLEQQMSLGEYVWIYVLAYNSWLEKEPNTALEDRDGRALTSKEARVMRTLMENHAEALDEAGESVTAERWRTESQRWKRGDDPAPFFGRELPEDLAVTFAPFRGQLESLYCESMAAFELSRIEKKGFGSFSSD